MPYSGIVSGESGWSLRYRVPAGWTYTLCKPAEVFISLWPEDQSSQSAKALIYVKVFPKGRAGFASFVAGKIADLRKKSHQLSQMTIGPQSTISPARRLIHIAHSTGDRDELVEYMQGLTDYFVVVLTTVSPATTAQYREAYMAFLDSLVTWPKKCPGHTCLIPPGHRLVEVCAWVRHDPARR